MKLLLILSVCTFCLSAFAGASFGLDAQDFAVFASEKPLSFDSLLEALAKADVVFIGEEHDHKLGHELELAILKGVYAHNPSLMLSLEMFERDVQPVVDEYLTDQITETHFLQSSRPWPNYKTDYAPLLAFCKENHLPVVAANAPRRYVNIVSRKGQQALLELPKASKAFLPPLPYAMTLPESYARQLNELFSGAHDSASSSSSGQPAPNPAMPSAENMVQAQGLWDATMAYSLLQARRADRHREILQINGSMHSDSGYGIVDRLRKAAPRLKILLVTMRPEAHFPDFPAGKYAGVADFVILTRAESKK